VRRPAVAPCLLLVVALAALPPGAAQETPAAGDWWRIPYPQPFDASSLEPTVPTLRVRGNAFVDDKGRRVVLEGMSISDPDKLVLDGRWSKSHFEAVKAWGADVVRIPVHPVAWRGRGKAGYFELLDQAVVWATELELYVMIDWHSIGNLLTEVFQHPMYDTTRRETLNFWRSVAARYRGIPTVAFYEIFNEPTTFAGQLGAASWDEWRRFNEEVIGIIFAHDTDVIPLVAGFDWAYSFESVGEAPIEMEGIGYVSHPYPQKVSAPFEEKWERDFGFVADRYPVFVTEFGYAHEGEPGAHVPVISSDGYPERILDYLADKGISWAAWCFDPEWGPHLISDWEYTPTASGAHFKAAMSRRD
jgi:aryl-phospho-beta-D-glucosidase BglC (GH1 family)